MFICLQFVLFLVSIVCLPSLDQPQAAPQLLPEWKRPLQPFLLQCRVLGISNNTEKPQRPPMQVSFRSPFALAYVHAISLHERCGFLNSCCNLQSAVPRFEDDAKDVNTLSATFDSVFRCLDTDPDLEVFTQARFASWSTLARLQSSLVPLSMRDNRMGRDSALCPKNL
jgi:hypothetical protein